MREPSGAAMAQQSTRCSPAVKQAGVAKTAIRRPGTAQWAGPFTEVGSSSGPKSEAEAGPRGH